jgi:plasmid stabilization system protein ParE
MEYLVHITRAAEKDIEYTIDYLDAVLKNPTAAERLYNQIKVKLPSLSTMPQRRAKVDDSILSSWGIRYLIIENYLAFYQIDEPTHTVHILRFLYEKSDWKNILKHDSIKYDAHLLTAKGSDILSDVK